MCVCVCAYYNTQAKSGVHKYVCGYGSEAIAAAAAAAVIVNNINTTAHKRLNE